MALEPGTQFGSYRVVEQIGSGGMGEVWRATDPTLKRDVALKGLPGGHNLDSEALKRFEREARLLAALNHPNIATLHGLETVGDQQALVMELVEGEGLDARIARAPDGLPVSEAIEIAEQIAAALEAAHERGILHRDLKPANIKIRPDGTVKVLDFGIAKAIATDDGPSTVSTFTQVPGAIVGTPSYMSPEQASGAEVDRRTDIWAFGCVLYEMLTGQRVFDGDTSSRVLARVLERDPQWDSLPRDLDPRIRTLLRQCLEKNVRRRRRDAGDVRLELESAAAEPADKARSRHGDTTPAATWVALSIAAVALAGAAALYVSGTEAPAPRSVVDIVTPTTSQPHEFAVSPDGRYITFIASASTDTIMQALYLRDLETGEVGPIPGTEGARNPCWSPDSRSIAFVAAEYLQRVDVNGGYPQRLAPALNGLGCSWGENGQILFTPSAVTEVYSVPETGGEHRPVTQIDLDREPDDPASETNHVFPSFVPGTQQFIYYVTGGRDVRGIHLASLDGGPSQRLIASDSAGTFIAPNWMVYGQNGRLLAQQVDLKRGQLTGEPVVLVESIDIPALRLPLSASRDGDLVAYRDMPAPSSRMTTFDRTGKELLAGYYLNGPDVSPDDRSIAYDAVIAGNRDVYVARVEGDDERGTVNVERITGDATVEGYPEFSPDGRELIYERQRPDDKFFELWRVEINRPDEARLFYSEAEDLRNLIPLDWSVNDWMVMRRSDADFLSSDLIAVSTTGESPTPVEVAATIYEERLAEVSPNGNWIAYDSNQPGRFGIFVQPFPDYTVGSRHQVTADGFAPRWSADGTEIYFLTLDGQVMAAPITDLGSDLRSGAPVELFRAWIGGPSFNHQYAITSEGRFFVNALDVDENPPPIKIIQNSTVFESR
jgi:eukaryotic-like serine/threonine-protein kinase